MFLCYQATTTTTTKSFFARLLCFTLLACAILSFLTPGLIKILHSYSHCGVLNCNYIQTSALHQPFGRIYGLHFHNILNAVLYSRTSEYGSPLSWKAQINHTICFYIAVKCVDLHWYQIFIIRQWRSFIFNKIV
jgi:hypothetical protein